MTPDTNDKLEELRIQLFDSRRISIGLLMAFVHVSSETSDIPTSWLLAYLVNNDRGILDCESVDQWPPGYLNEVEDFCDIIHFYMGHQNQFPPVVQSTQTMKDWPFLLTSNHTIH